MIRRILLPIVALAVAASFLAATCCLAQEPAVTTPVAAPSPPTPNYSVAVDTIWVMIGGMLVFFMNLGFGCVEAGMCRAKNCVNILSKNFIVFAVSTVAFWMLGWGIMFGNNADSPWFGKEGLWFVSDFAYSETVDNSPATGADYKGYYGAINWTGVPLAAKFFFQLVFAGTAATIVSGAVAERIKYLSFIVFTFFMGIVIYPVVGHWIWGGGFLAQKGFADFAGSTQVHSIGGWAALVGILFLGPRIGKYGPDGRVNAIPGHSMMAAFIGCFVLWFGWFGFNPGSTMGIALDQVAPAEVAIVTNLAAAVAACTATATAWIMLGKPDIGMTLNGCLAGLVAITAPCAFVDAYAAAVIGAIAGVLVVVAVMTFDRFKIDDPVGATSVHLVNGVFGTICIGLFAHPARTARYVPFSPEVAMTPGLFYGGGTTMLVRQLIGVGLTAAYVLVASTVVWAVIKYTIGLRVSEQEELEGLDFGEHGNESYHGFVMARSEG
ncbi:MAG: ammonium transporter [Planctomycetes bacterium]|nr:ammonium transporter [Planctomycetota bacterium]